MCSNVFQCVENLFKCVGFGCYKWLGWVFGGNDCFLVVTSDYECIWGEYGCFLGFQVVMGVFGWSLGG